MIRFEDLRVTDTDTLDRLHFNRRYRLIAEALNGVDQQVALAKASTDNLLQAGLTRVNEVLQPALERVSKAAELGFLVATSSQAADLDVGGEGVIEVDDQGGRAVWAPTPYVLIAPADGGAGVGDYAVVKAQSYNNENGGFAYEVAALGPDWQPGARSGWVLSASAGLAPNVMQAAADVSSAMTAINQAVTAAQDAAQAAEEVIADGPVSSVNGYTGIVSLGMSDIPGLNSALGGKADTTHGHTIAQISGLPAELDGKAPASHTHTIAQVSGLQGALDDIDGGSY